MWRIRKRTTERLTLRPDEVERAAQRAADCFLFANEGIAVPGSRTRGLRLPGVRIPLQITEGEVVITDPAIRSQLVEVGLMAIHFAQHPEAAQSPEET
jgi:hypothetical protein